MKQEDKPVVRLAKAVLDFNWTGGYTNPSPRLYTHQWSWDSALIAIGYARYDQGRAEAELMHLLESQWQNGLLPHEVHDPKLAGEGAGGLGFWDASGDPRSPDDRQTSGEIQPPVHATAALYTYRHAADEARAKRFLEEAFPRLSAWHEYLHRERDPYDEGLVYVRHPWETGTDNSPAWDTILQRIQLGPDEIPDFHRGDIAVVPLQDRPLNTEYDRYAWLVKRFAEHDYDEAKIREDCPFLVQDALFNALLSKSNRDLAEISRILGEDPSGFEERAEKTARAMNEKLWDEEHATYLDHDLVVDRPLQVFTTAGFLPLFAGVPDEDRARRMVEALERPNYGLGDDDTIPVSSYDRYGYGFSPDRYWRGPVWINVNWMLMRGLERYGYDEHADYLRRTIVNLVESNGFHEYFDAEGGHGHGTGFFSWTASLFLDVALEDRQGAP